MPPERTLTAIELNRALLARQFLLKPSSLPLVSTIERIGGLQTQYAPSGYIGAWSRMASFERNDLTRALEERHLIQGTSLRSTIHTQSAADYWVFLAGTRPSRREWFLRITRKEHGELDMERAAATVRELLKSGPQRLAALRQALAAAGMPAISWAGLSAWIDMVRVPPSGTWHQRRADLYALAEQWIAPVKHSEQAGLMHLVRRYLGGFGPATSREIAAWAGVPPAKVAPVINRVTLRRFRDPDGTALVDLPRAPIPDASTPAPVRFLPTWDATLLVHARRTQILPEPFRPRVFNTRTPHSVPTFLIDGQVAGTWRYEGGRVITRPFEPLSPHSQRAVDSEAARLAAFHR